MATFLPKHVFPHVLRRAAHDRFPVDEHVARGGVERRNEQPHAAVDERRFAAPGFARDAEHFALFDGKGDAGDRVDLFVEPREIVQRKVC